MCAVSRLIAEESAMLSYIPVILVVGIHVGIRAELLYCSVRVARGK